MQCIKILIQLTYSNVVCVFPAIRLFAADTLWFCQLTLYLFIIVNCFLFNKVSVSVTPHQPALLHTFADSHVACLTNH